MQNNAAGQLPIVLSGNNTRISEFSQIIKHPKTNTTGWIIVFEDTTLEYNGHFVLKGPIRVILDTPLDMTTLNVILKFFSQFPGSFTFATDGTYFNQGAYADIYISSFPFFEIHPH